MRSLTAAIVASALIVASAVPAAAVTLLDVADGYALSLDNFITTPTVFAGPSLIVARLGVHETRTALEFDLSSLPAGAPVTSAVLRLWFTASDTLVGVYGAAGDGAITAADFMFDGQIATFDPASPVPPAPPALNEIDVTSFIGGMLGSHFVVFQLRELYLIDFNSIVGGALPSPFAPRLEVTVPAPASLLLLVLASGLAGLGRLARRRRR